VKEEQILSYCDFKDESTNCELLSVRDYDELKVKRQVRIAASIIITLPMKRRTHFSKIERALDNRCTKE